MHSLAAASSERTECDVTVAAARGRPTSRCNGPRLALLAPAAERGRSAALPRLVLQAGQTGVGAMKLKGIHARDTGCRSGPRARTRLGARSPERRRSVRVLALPRSRGGQCPCRHSQGLAIRLMSMAGLVHRNPLSEGGVTSSLPAAEMVGLCGHLVDRWRWVCYEECAPTIPSSWRWLPISVSSLWIVALLGWARRVSTAFSSASACSPWSRGHQLVGRT